MRPHKLIYWKIHINLTNQNAILYGSLVTKKPELKDKNEVLNQDIADKQFEVLARKHIWLSDEEVEAMLNIKPGRKS